MNWNQDNYQKAWNFASRVHNGQLVPGGDIPYINHLGLVAMEAMSAAASGEPVQSPDLLVLAALLHDTLEDTSTTYEQLKQNFGTSVADGVLALTKNDSLATKKEKMRDSLLRIKMQPKEIWMVKMCDRITNLQPPPEHWSKEKIQSYYQEALIIFNELKAASDFLARRLEEKIRNYERYAK
jgi:(p)ppGpp synthase/HD superfamily hydrolase